MYLPNPTAPALTLFYLTTSTLASTLVESLSQDNSPQCDCYLISGPDAGYFQHHRFWDFRAIPSDGSDDYTTAPPLIIESEDSGAEATTSSFFTADAWTNSWDIQNWTQAADDVSPVKSVNSPQNVFISRNTTDPSSTTYLTLRASRTESFMSIAELDYTPNNMLHSSIRARLRIIPNGLSNPPAPSSGDTSTTDRRGNGATHPVDPGAVASLFIYESSTSESDIEILTRDPLAQIRYSNQPDFDPVTGNTVSGASTDYHMRDGTYTEWLEYRLDWFRQVSRWYVDGQLQLNKTLNVPRKASGLILNLWGDGGEWSGNMSVGGQVVMGVEWVEMVFNLSGSGVSEGHSERSERVCQVGCYVDGVSEIGAPELAFNSTGNAASGQFGGAANLWAVVAMVGLAVGYLVAL